MENKNTTKILIIDESVDFANGLRECFKKENENYKISISNNGEDGINKIKTESFDLVITDIVLPKCDGFEVLENITKLSIKPKTLILTCITQESIINKAMDLGAGYVLTKSSNPQIIVKRSEELLFQSPKQPTVKLSKVRALDEKISNIFITVGIPAHIKGYQFLREAIKMAIDNPEIINSITKQLYPSIATRFETSASKVERAIRHAIEVAWNRGKIENINNLFGIKVYSSNEKPTNGEFIALVADKMLIEGA